jgi:hypothetical protein
MRKLLGYEIEVEIKNKKGEIEFKKTIEGKSWLRQIIDWYAMHFRPYGYHVAIKAVDGNTYNFPVWSTGDNIYAWYLGLNLNAGEGVSYRGIVLGTGTTSNSINTYKLEAQISHGSGAGQLYYSTTSVSTVVVGDTNIRYFEITRYFQNRSGVDITVNEIGLYAYFTDNGTNWRGICIARDLTGGIVVPANSTLIVRYKPRIVIV